MTFSRLPPQRLARSACVTAGTYAVGRQLVKARCSELQEPLGHSTLQIEEEQVVDEGLVRLDLASQRPQETARGGRLLSKERQESVGTDCPDF